MFFTIDSWSFLYFLIYQTVKRNWFKPEAISRALSGWYEEDNVVSHTLSPFPEFKAKELYPVPCG